MFFFKYFTVKVKHCGEASEFGVKAGMTRKKYSRTYIL